jgi:hypothetical protein
MDENKPVRELYPREQLLREAEKIVTKDRNSVYGAPEDNFRDIAQLWSAYMNGRPPISVNNPFSSMDVVVMNMLIKVARLKKTPDYHDGLVDIAGYAACGADIQEVMKKAAAGLSGGNEIAGGIGGILQGGGGYVRN